MDKLQRAKKILDEHFVPYISIGETYGGDVQIEVNAATTIARENFKTRLEILGFVKVRHYMAMTPDGPYVTINFDLPEPTLSEAFAALATSTAAFHERFETDKHSTLRDARKVMREEFQEVEQELDSLPFTSYRDIAHEMADLVVTVLGAAIHAGVSEADLAAAMLEVAAKNDRKTLDNCVWHNGKVTRKEKLEKGNG